jgi:heat shock transcription factor
MVNDPSDHDLIRWSDTGDSFFVLDQERFASEVLGRWFKHKNFSSFVRQLNMYGFHKIPHLQQGVLRSDSDTEFWNFEHPHFLRGQPDMLCLIQRKKQTASASDVAAVVAEVPNKDVGAAASVGALTPGQLMDMNSIVNGIQAIKRHQAAISADLNDLKSSNQHLWQEAIAARERHKKHQDTINRILKFLAGVFGHADNPIRKDDIGGGGVVSGSEGGEIVARKPQRLMISDGRSGGGSGAKKGVDVTETTEDQQKTSIDSAKSSEMDFFATLDTPSAIPSEYGHSCNTSPRFASVEPSLPDAPTPSVDANTTSCPNTAPNNTVNTINPNPSNINAALPTSPNNSFSRPTPIQHSVSAPAFTSLTTTPPPPSPQNDALIHAALSQVLSSPVQMQKLIAALGGGGFSFSDGHTQGMIPQSIIQQPFPNQPQSQPQLQPQLPQQHTNANPTQLMPYDPATFQTDYPSPYSLSQSGGADLAAFEAHDDHLQKTYSTAHEINTDVDSLETNIQSLIQSLGLDPSTFDATDGAQPHLDDPYGVGSGQDSFDIGSYLNGMDLGHDAAGHTGQGEEDPDMESLRLADKLDSSTARGAGVDKKVPSEEVNAFLDGVASQDGGVDMAASLMQTTQSANSTRGRKRKSDIADVGSLSGPTESISSSEGIRTKRKR